MDGNDSSQHIAKHRKARCSAEYRAEALSLAKRIGVAATTSKLGLRTRQILQLQARAAHERSFSFPSWKRAPQGIEHVEMQRRQRYSVFFQRSNILFVQAFEFAPPAWLSGVDGI